MRGLAKVAPIEPSLLSSTELKQRLRAQLFYSQEDARRDALVMSAFDFMARDFDLYRLTHRYIGREHRRILRPGDGRVRGSQRGQRGGFS